MAVTAINIYPGYESVDGRRFIETYCLDHRLNETINEKLYSLAIHSNDVISSYNTMRLENTIQIYAKNFQFGKNTEQTYKAITRVFELINSDEVSPYIITTNLLSILSKIDLEINPLSDVPLPPI